MINPLDERYLGSACEIRSFSNDLLALGIINNFGEDFIEIHPRDDRLRLFNTGTKLKLNIFNSKAGFCVLICEVLTSSRTFLKIVEPLRIIDRERRCGFRVAVDTDARISEDNVFSDNPQPEKIQIALVNDMSVCGLRIFSTRSFILNQIFWLELNLNGSFLISKAQVMRVSDNFIKKSAGIKMQEYGIKLIFSRPEDADKLCSYIFKRQREISNKIK